MPTLSPDGALRATGGPVGVVGWGGLEYLTPLPRALSSQADRYTDLLPSPRLLLVTILSQ